MAAAWRAPLAMSLAVMLPPSARAVDLASKPSNTTARRAFLFANTVGVGQTVSGSTWTQVGGSAWSGARGSQVMCSGGDSGEYKFSVAITQGTYHQIGVATEACCTSSRSVTSSTNSADDFACLYSHSAGWNRHRGAAEYVGTPSYSDWWTGTWDGAPRTFDLTVKCATRSFVVGEPGVDDFLGEMSWPSSWSGAYMFVGGQSSDHIITVTSTSSMVSVSAKGDPHLTNVHGEKFDLMAPGKHLLIRIPRTRVQKALLRVDAEAQRLGGQCADIYFQELNVTGAWADAKQAGGFRYQAHVAGKHANRAHWVSLGPMQLKVAHGRTQTGITYLNLYVKNLERAGYAVGGLLGEDDHTDAAMTPEACVHRMAL